MAIKEFAYTKEWTNPADFSTYEGSEEKVREDMQYPLDEIKKYLNGTLLPGLKEGALPEGGEKGQALVKRSDKDGDVAWQFAPGGGGEISEVGYYVPEVKNGTLSWTPSHASMPDVPPSDISGPVGAQGPVGARGPQGEQGIRGAQGPIGPQGPKGETGAEGKSAYQEAVDNGYEGSVEDWLENGFVAGFYKPVVDASGNLSWTPSNSDMPSVASANIRGPQGPTGAQGPEGPTGSQGPTGKSAFELAKENGYEGSVEDWLESGAVGGYYTPSVNEEGILNWTPSNSDLPTVPPANVKGDTPQRGTDYWTPEDVEAIAAQAKESIAPLRINSISVTETDTSASIVFALAEGNETLDITFDDEGVAKSLKWKGNSIPLSWAVS